MMHLFRNELTYYKPKINLYSIIGQTLRHPLPARGNFGGRDGVGENCGSVGVHVEQSPAECAHTRVPETYLRRGCFFF